MRVCAHTHGLPSRPRPPGSGACRVAVGAPLDTDLAHVEAHGIGFAGTVLPAACDTCWDAAAALAVLGLANGLASREHGDW